MPSSLAHPDNKQVLLSLPLSLLHTTTHLHSFPLIPSAAPTLANNLFFLHLFSYILSLPPWYSSCSPPPLFPFPPSLLYPLILILKSHFSQPLSCPSGLGRTTWSPLSGRNTFFRGLRASPEDSHRGANYRPPPCSPVAHLYLCGSSI